MDVWHHLASFISSRDSGQLSQVCKQLFNAFSLLKIDELKRMKIPLRKRSFTLNLYHPGTIGKALRNLSPIQAKEAANSLREKPLVFFAGTLDAELVLLRDDVIEANGDSGELKRLVSCEQDHKKARVIAGIIPVLPDEPRSFFFRDSALADIAMRDSIDFGEALSIVKEISSPNVKKGVLDYLKFKIESQRNELIMMRRTQTIKRVAIGVITTISVVLFAWYLRN